MRFVVAALLLCGCNQVFGLNPTEALPPTDAQYFDAPPDAPFTCPPAGTLPQFSPVLHQIQQNCRFYTRSADWATAECRDMPTRMAQGAPDGPFASIGGLEDDFPFTYENPQLAPEGDELFVRYSDPGAATGEIKVFRRSGNSWTEAGAVSINGVTITAEVAFGTPSRAPNRRMFVSNYDISEIREIELDATYHGTVVATYTPQEVDTFLRSQPNLTPDGLRIIFSVGGAGRDQVGYGDRASLADRFTFQLLPDAPTGETPFLTEDCGRLYFSAASSVLWVQQ
ncbi:MAG: hypothetical protein HOV81_30270 [Kofleriaceae bacterium]|nr:hypothetical protein [Kofleriaceae bacterium]